MSAGRTDPDSTAGPGGRTDRQAASTVWERARHGYPAAYPVAQLPNAPVLVASAGLLVGALTEGPVQDHARAVAWVALAAWAWLELTDGVNLFRRALGAAVLVGLVLRIGAALGA